MSTAAERLGHLVKQRRESLGIYTVSDAASRAGLTRATWTNVENGEPAKPVTYRKVEALLQWEPGSCGTVLAGGDPVVQGPAPEVEITGPGGEKITLSEARRKMQEALELLDQLEREQDEARRRGA